MQPGAGALADGVEPGEGGPAVEVGGHPAHHVVRGGRDRDQLALGVDARPRAARSTTLGNSAGSTSRMSSRTGVPPLASIWRWTARATSSRGASSSTKRSPAGVEQPRALAADRLGDQEAVGAGSVSRADHRGVKLHELEVGELGARRVGEQQPGPDRARRVGGALPQGGGAAGGQHDRARRDHRAVVERNGRRRGRRRSGSAWRGGPPGPRSARPRRPAPTAGG